MYIVIDKDYKISQRSVLNGRSRRLARDGKLSVLHVRRRTSDVYSELELRGMNLPLSSEEERDGEWSEIQQD